MNISRVGPVRISKIDGGVFVECDLSELPDRHWMIRLTITSASRSTSTRSEYPDRR